MKQHPNPLCKVKTAKQHHLVLFQLYITHKTVKPMPDLTSQSCGDLKLADCLSKGDEPFKDHLSTHGRLTRLRNKPQQKQPGSFSTDTCLIYIYCVTLAAVMCLWMLVISNPVT